MSQRDLVAELRAARVEAPTEVRERVRGIAAAAPRPPRRLTRRRTFAVAVPLAAALAAVVVVTRPAGHKTSVQTLERPAVQHAAAPTVTAGKARAGSAVTVPPATRRVQVYGATLGLRVESAGAVSDAVKRAVAVAASLGGYTVSVHASTHGKQGVADLRLKVPRAHVQQALTRLSRLGTITDENVSTVDRQALLDATDREIARLQRQLAVLRAQPSTPQTERRSAALVARIQTLQRGSAATRRAAHYATIDLHVETPLVTVQAKHGHGRLHGVVVALTWLGIGAVYVLAIGLPVAVVGVLAWLAVRTVRRRREDALLSRS